MAYLTKSLTIVITLLMFNNGVYLNSYQYDYNPYVKEYTKNITLKQGVLQGVIVEPKINSENQYRVGVFKGIPYAAPPIGDLRFMPTAGAPSWFGIKYADQFGPVCPQKLPDERKMPAFRKEYFLRLKSYLQNQSEDCLYLNIYAPIRKHEITSRKYPVMVYIHGESFEWNSGNPYDGTVLAAYGNVIVVTLNFRLGILGFLKAGVEDTSRSNFGLVDQVAALVWIRDNIAAFGGDSNSVTLIGHGTGAVCASLLMISPMILIENERLFHRAILMSGTALSDWALASSPNEVAYQVSKAVNCQIHDDFAECLRKKRLEEIMAAGAITPDYKTRFGPIVDSLVVPNEPKKCMTQYHDIFRRFEVIYGVNEIESINLLDPIGLSHGLLLKERDQELRTYFRSRCEMKPEVCLQRTLDEYGANDILTNVNSGQKYSYQMYEPNQAIKARDVLLDILSDARSVAPMIQTAKYHSLLNMQSYFYVFKHKTTSKNYIREKTYTGEELPYVFGIPLGGPKYHFTDKYTDQERLFSEIVMMYFSNFAETGNPNVPRRNLFINLSPAYWTQFDVDWPEFDNKNERYLELEIPPQPLTSYRKEEMKYWNEMFSKVLENNSFNMFSTKKPVFDNFGSVPPRRPNHPPPWIYDHYPKKPADVPKNFEKPQSKVHTEQYGKIVKEGNDRPDNIVENVFGKILEKPPQELEQSSAVNVLTITGVVCLFISVTVFIVLYFICYRRRKQVQVQQSNLKNTSKDNQAFLIDGCNIMKMINTKKSNETYEGVRSESSPNYKLTRQISSSTIDAHTKVREWITHEIIQKYSPHIFRRTCSSNETKDQKGFPKKHVYMDVEENMLGDVPFETYIKTSTIRRPKPPKISVEVDATPSGRGPSILLQEPIEMTKSLDNRVNRYEQTKPLRRSFTMENVPSEVINCAKEIDKSISTTDLNNTVRPIHKHTVSDPVEDLEYLTKTTLKTFDYTADVNVTSRDENDMFTTQLSPEQSLNLIKRRNFPKVLPDYPDKAALINKRRSMPIARSMNTDSSFRYPPMPPPRTTTLTKQATQVYPVYISEPTLAEEPYDQLETVCNNLYVGPILPKNKTENKPSVTKHENKIDTYDQPKEPIVEAEPRRAVGPSPKIGRADPKVIIKPSLPKKVGNEKPKNITRVVVPDNQPFSQQNTSDRLKEVNSDNKEKTNFGKFVHVETQCEQRSQDSQKTTSSIRPNQGSLSSDSTPSEESDTGTVVKKI
ncbi:unnamed protein product [Diabrotica balteata]|uniref:Carboxylesterase type B domain-containing protein n=1 Tax=Diabrotica balteata TaxID=107213 RepID=A0A9N9X9A2_DIABA|nr:unnamed protein product [Diabrotica balteata]